MTFTPSTRRQLDGVAVWSPSARFSLRDGILAEKGLSEELSGAPYSLMDLRTGLPVPALSASLAYYDSLRRPYLENASLIQAQRDCFGGHTYRR